MTLLLILGHFLMARTPDRHRYDSVWKSVRNRVYMDFVIQACGHGHVVLAAEEGQTTNNVYEYVIGGWDNNRTVIRTEILGNYKVGADTPHILDCGRIREFWISWLDGTFTVRLLLKTYISDINICYSTNVMFSCSL